jgi:hypothetical protein
MSYSPTGFQLTDNSQVKGSTLLWIAFGIISSTLGATLFLAPKLYEEAPSGTCTGGECCKNGCAPNIRKVFVAALIITGIVGIGGGFLLHQASKSAGGAGIGRAAYSAIASPIRG